MQLPAPGLIAAVAALHFYIAWFGVFASEEKSPRIFTAVLGVGPVRVPLIRDRP